MKSLNQQKNRLKDLIYIQENKSCDEQTIKGLFRSIVEPVLENDTEGVVFYRLEPKSKQSFAGILKRLSYSGMKVFDFSDESTENFKNFLSEKIWDKTEFVYILSKRYGASFIFDYELSEAEGFAGIYILHNSKNLSDTFEIINANSNKDLSYYNQEKFHPDRRDNLLLNNSIRKIVEVLNESNQEILISEIEKESLTDKENLQERLDFISDKSRYVSHELRNHLSICELYSNIIEKQLARVSISDVEVEKSVKNAISCIQKSLKMAGVTLFDLKSLNNNDLKHYSLNDLIELSINLSKIYVNGKNISINYEKASDELIYVDENKFLAVLINLIKNAIESIDEQIEIGEINIKTGAENNQVFVAISNNGRPIKRDLQDKIFEDGFSTKTSGSGVGLYICKKSLQEQFAQLKLKKSDEISTEFEILLPKMQEGKW